MALAKAFLSRLVTWRRLNVKSKSLQSALQPQQGYERFWLESPYELESYCSEVIYLRVWQC
jgi:hypothetical protein